MTGFLQTVENGEWIEESEAEKKSEPRAVGLHTFLNILNKTQYVSWRNLGFFFMLVTILISSLS